MCPQVEFSPLWASTSHQSDAGMDWMLPFSLLFSESVTVTGVRRHISWASTFPLLSPVGKGARLCFLQANGSYHGGPFPGFCGER